MIAEFDPVVAGDEGCDDEAEPVAVEEEENGEGECRLDDDDSLLLML